MRSRWLASLFLVCFTAARSAHAAEVPMGFEDKMIAGGLMSPTAITALPDGRMLVVQQNGVIRTVKDDVMLPDSYWEVPNVDSTFERGCLGITPDPAYETNHYVYAYCSIKNDSTSKNQVLRVTEVDGHADQSTQMTLIELSEIRVQFHMGGALRFGNDGMLYVAVGNHEDGPVDDSNSQILSNPLGKILRIRPDGSIPDDNPFVNESGAYPAIYAYGYRNPFAFDIQPGTGKILVGDVGQAMWEEIDDCERGANYGWSLAEGPSTDSRFKAPLYSYEHADGRCAITGGAFYNPKTAQFPEEYVGTYLYEEFCTGQIEVFDPATAQARPFVTGINYPVNMAVAPDGSLYYMARNQDTMTHDPNVGTLSKISYSGSAAPRISKNPMSQTIVLGDPVTFEVAAQDAKNIQWQRDGADIAGATGNKYTIDHTTADDNAAKFVAVAENDFGKTSSLAAELTVTTNHPPKATIEGDQRIEYAPGEMVTLKGSATDAEDGALPADAFTWQVDYQHDTHTHPFLAATSGKDSITFMVPSFEADEPDTWVRVELFVKDSGGATHSVYRDIYPRTQLSSLTPLDPTMGDLQRDKSSSGKPLKIDNVAFNTGLGVHAPSDVRYHLDGRCDGKFVAALGLDDEVADRGSVVFQVFLDDDMVYDSGVKHGNDGRTNLAIDVKGSRQLRLVVTDGGDGDKDDNADWGAARILGCDMSIAAPSSSKSDDKPKDPAKPAADSSSSSSKGTPSAAEPRAGDKNKDAGVDAGKPKSSTSSSRSDSTSSADTKDDASPEPASDHHKSGCSVGQLTASRTPTFTWFVLLVVGTALWRKRRL